MFRSILILILLFSCSHSVDNVLIKNNDQSTQETNVQGKWNWVKSTGGLAGWTLTPESEGISRTIEFTGSLYRMYENGILIREYHYSIVEENSIYNSGKTQQIKYDVGENQSYTIESGPTIKLILNDECYDCYTSEYVKIED